LTFIVMELPALCVAPLAGALVDRWDRRRVMLACACISTLNVVLLAILMANDSLAIWQIYVGVAITALCTTFHAPAFMASIPMLATPEQLPRVNGMVQSGNAIAAIVGPLAAGVLISTISIHGVLLIDAASFACAAVCLLISRIPQPVRAACHGDSKVGLLQEAGEGWRYVHQRPGLAGLLAVDGVNGFAFALAGVLIAPLVLSFSNTAMVGVQYSISATGLLLGGMALAAHGGPQRRVHGILGCSFLAGFCLALHGLHPSLVLICGAGFAMFLMLPVIAASNSSLWQRKVPATLQGRCFAMQQVISNAVSPLGYCLAGPLSELVFEPLLATGGAWSSSVGVLIGTGPGRGTALLFVILGALMMVMAVAAYGLPAIRHVDELPDALCDQALTSMATHSGAASSEHRPVLLKEAR
jgi:hypothetical protein